MTPQELAWNRQLYEAKETQRLVRITDIWHRVHEGRIYRNGTDRVNVVSIDVRNSVELYYTQLRTVEILGPEPEGLPPFPVDWNKLCWENQPLHQDKTGDC